MKQFQISTGHTRYRTVKVCVYDTAERMRKAAIRYSKSIGDAPKIGWDNTHGVCQSFERTGETENGRILRFPEAGFIRLYRDGLTTGIIAHECTHMAWSIYQQDVQKTIPDIDREEILCYLVGDLTSRLVNKLYKYNLFPAD